MKIKFLIILFVFCLPASTFAEQLSCQHGNYRFQNDQLILSTHSTAQQLYLLHNKSAQAIYVNHQKIPAGASAGWMSQLDPQQWSAIATQQKNFSITCTLAQSGNFAKQSCHDVLTVCFLPHAMFPQNLRNTAFWVAENKTRTTLVAAIKQRGIKISH